MPVVGKTRCLEVFDGECSPAITTTRATGHASIEEIKEVMASYRTGSAWVP
jgi:hypothetical protein